MKPQTYVMGDIHGNYKALDQCLERCHFDLELDTLIQLGDVCDRHPQSAYVVDQLQQIPNLVAIRGNHDLWLESWLKDGEEPEKWLENGGRSTIASYIQSSDSIHKSQHIKFFEKQKNYHIDDENRLFVHAGYASLKGPEYEYPAKNCYWDRTLWLDALDGRKEGKQPERLKNFSEVFVGHTPTLNWKQETPMQAFNLWNIDTGAGWNGKLTIMNVRTKEYWQSDTASSLYS